MLRAYACAAKLRDSGRRVTMLARDYGLVLEDIVSGHRSITQVDTTESLNPHDRFAVRRDQLDSAVQDFAANRRIPTILLVPNNPNGSRHFVKIMGEERAPLGFPGACPLEGTIRFPVR
jgi:hypothetical protein